MPTARLYHPFESAARAGAPAGRLGSVLSIFTVTTGLVTVPHVKTAVHWRLLEPSAVINSAIGQPLVETRSPLSTTLHLIVTLLVNQPFVPLVPVSEKLTGGASPPAAGASSRNREATTPTGVQNRRSDDPSPARTDIRLPPLAPHPEAARAERAPVDRALARPPRSPHVPAVAARIEPLLPSCVPPRPSQPEHRSPWPRAEYLDAVSEQLDVVEGGTRRRLPAKHGRRPHDRACRRAVERRARQCSHRASGDVAGDVGDADVVAVANSLAHRPVGEGGADALVDDGPARTVHAWGADELDAHDVRRLLPANPRDALVELGLRLRELRSRGVVGEGVADLGAVSRRVLAGPDDGGLRQVRPGVTRRRRAGGHSGRDVRAGEAHGDGLAVPAARVRLAVRRRRHRRRRRVVLEAQARGRAVASDVGARPGETRGGVVATAVSRARAAGQPGDGILRAKGRGDRMVEPAVRVGLAAQRSGDGRRSSSVDLDGDDGARHGAPGEDGRALARRGPLGGDLLCDRAVRRRDEVGGVDGPL